MSARKPCGVYIGKIVRIHRLRVHSLFCGTHAQVEQLIHRLNDVWFLTDIQNGLVSVSDAVITWAFAWKLRCELITLTSCAVSSTFDSSIAPEFTTPRRPVPAHQSAADRWPAFQSSSPRPLA